MSASCLNSLTHAGYLQANHEKIKEDNWKDAKKRGLKQDAFELYLARFRAMGRIEAYVNKEERHTSKPTAKLAKECNNME